MRLCYDALMTNKNMKSKKKSDFRNNLISVRVGSALFKIIAASAKGAGVSRSQFVADILEKKFRG